MPKYVPGKCNIGQKERLKRAAFGLSLVLFSLLAWWVFWSFDAPRAYRLALFFPLFLGFLGTFQAKYGFCVGNGLKGTCAMW